jgi:hypothetical protein
MYELEGPRIYVGAHAAVPLVSWLCSTPELRVIITSNVKRDSHDNLSYPFTVLDNSGGDQVMMIQVVTNPGQAGHTLWTRV